MATINFPTTPSLYQTYTAGTKTWIWNGYAWDLQVANSISLTASTQAAFNQANGAYSLANTTVGVDATQNTNITTAQSTATGAFLQANAAFNKANSVTGITYTASTTAPVSPHVGDQWFNTYNNILLEYVTDGTTNTWIDISSSALGSNTVAVDVWASNQANAAYNTSNAIYNQVTSAYNTANSAFNKANTIPGGGRTIFNAMVFGG